MTRTLLISASPGEIWAALEEGGELEALRVIRTGHPSLVGAIAYGRVVALQPELPAALVEIGEERPGFLDAADADPHRGIDDLREGQAVIVAVTRDARADKAVGLRFLRGDSAENTALEAAARTAMPPVWLKPPRAPLVTVLSAFLPTPPDRIVIDDRGAFAEARTFLAREANGLADRVVLYSERAPLFEESGIAAAIDEALVPRVALAGGGTLMFETTQAAMMIDVDGGKRNALAANLEAAARAARQIRLRNLAGPIVIDFIGMKKRGDRDKVLATLEAAFAGDPEKPQILGWTRLGHVELVRRRRLPAVSEILLERGTDGGWRKTALTLALAALRAAAREAMAEPGRPLILAAHADVVAALRQGEGLAARQMLEKQLGRALELEPRATGSRDVFDIRSPLPT